MIDLSTLDTPAQANIGTAVHAWIEAHTLGRPLEPHADPAIAPYQPAWLSFLELP